MSKIPWKILQKNRSFTTCQSLFSRVGFSVSKILTRMALLHYSGGVTSSTTPPRTVFAVHCPALDEEVKLLHDTWHGHILRIHPYMKGKDSLIKGAILALREKKNFFRLFGDPADSWFTDYQCPHFLPMHRSMRIAFKRLPNVGVIVATAYKLEKGIVSYE